MKKTILALALVVGLTSFAGNAKAAIITQNLNQTSSSPSGQSIFFGYDNINQSIRTISTGAWGVAAVFGKPGSESTDIPAFGFIDGVGLSAWSRNPISFGQDIITGAGGLSGYGGGLGGYTTATSGYYGVIFNNTNSPSAPKYYGWVNVIVDATSISFAQAAVETTANAPINAGQTAAVPEASQVAASLLLLVGISGFVIVKRKKALSA